MPCVFEDGTLDTRIGEVGVFQDGAAEHRIIKAGTGEAGAAQIRAREIGFLRGGTGQVGCKATCRRALEDSDMVMISGGSSVGTRDLTIDVLSKLPQSKILVHGISMRPGKPDVEGTLLPCTPGGIAKTQ